MSSLFCLDYYNFGGLEVMYYDYIACFLCFSPKTTLDSLILFHYHVQVRIRLSVSTEKKKIPGGVLIGIALNEQNNLGDEMTS